MKTAKALVVAAGLVLASGSALAQRVDEDELLGAWDTHIEEATVRILLVENGSYLVLHILPGDEDPIETWEVGEWDVRRDEVTFTPIAISNGEDLTETIAKVEDLEDGVLLLSSDEIGELEFERAASPVVGTWKGDTDEGTAYFAMSCDGGFAGSFGERDTDTFWGSWEQDGDDIVFSVTEEEWSLDGGQDFEEHEGVLEDFDRESLTMTIDGLSEDEIEWERIAAHPLIGTWTGDVDEGEITLELDEEGTFSVSMEGEEQAFSGVWTVVSGRIVLALIMDGEDAQVETLTYVLTSPDTAMLGQGPEEMEEFTRN